MRTPLIVLLTSVACSLPPTLRSLTSIPFDTYNIDSLSVAESLDYISEHLENLVSAEFLANLEEHLLDVWTSPITTLPNFTPLERQFLAFETFSRSAGIVERVHEFAEDRKALRAKFTSAAEIHTMMKNSLQIAILVQSEIAAISDLESPAVVTSDVFPLLDSIFAVDSSPVTLP